jgi:hypothetical protein
MPEPTRRTVRFDCAYLSYELVQLKVSQTTRDRRANAMGGFASCGCNHPELKSELFHPLLSIITLNSWADHPTPGLARIKRVTRDSENYYATIRASKRNSRLSTLTRCNDGSADRVMWRDVTDTSDMRTSMLFHLDPVSMEGPGEGSGGSKRHCRG